MRGSAVLRLITSLIPTCPHTPPHRSSSKITFPATWTNACCSHPLWDIPGEREEAQHLGIKRAAVRKCKDELGIDAPALLNADSLHFMTRIHYLAPSGGLWGEHEVDGILVFVGDVPLVPNPEEVADVRYVTPAELRAMRAGGWNVLLWLLRERRVCG